MARAPQLVGHPGIEQQAIHRRRVGQGPAEVGGGTHPDRLPDLHIQALPKGAAAFDAFLAVQLQHLVAPRSGQVGQLRVAGIRHHKHTPAVGPLAPGRGEQGGPLPGRDKACRTGHADHTDRIGAQGCHGRSLLRSA